MKFRLLVSLFLLFSCRASLWAEIRVIPEREYFGVVQEELTRARESIEITMFLMKLNDNSPRVKELLDDLVIAQKRGVKVKCILEDQRDNDEAYQYLKERVSIQFDSPELKTHAKKILIDGKRLIIGSSNWSEAAFGKNHESNVLVDLEEDKDKIVLLGGEDYIAKLIETLKGCRESLDIVMYLFLVKGKRSDDPAYQIMNEIFRLKREGVKIRLILDSWEEEVWSENEEIRSLLGLADINVYYDRGNIATHNKLVIVDRKEVLLGSANWTRQALSENQEASVFIKDRGIAGRYADYFDALLKEIPEVELKDRYFPLPIYFIKKDGPLNRLVLQQADKSLRLYLWLIWEAFSQDKVKFTIDEEGWYQAIFLPEKTSRPRFYKRLIIDHCLGFLERKGLLRRDRDTVILLDPQGDKALWSFPKENYFYVPAKLMHYGWFKKLSSRALYGYFINLAQFKFSSAKPYWFNSYTRMENEYNLNRTTLNKAFHELMASNLIEIIHDIPDPGQDFADRKANRYLINTLLSEEEIKTRWQALEKKYGELFFKARAMAASINEAGDPEVVADLIMLINVYGEGVIREVIAKVNGFSFDSGKREMRYIIGILQHNYKPK